MDDKPARILVVDDEEAILETMTFTFEDDYEVFTASDAREALELLDRHQPIAVVLTDQRMPNMSGVEFVTEVCRRHPSTVRMVLTGFSDIDAIIQAINDGHVYAYVTKPWEPEQLKQLMKQAVEHHRLAVENERLLVDLRRAKVFLQAVMDEVDAGALAIDASGWVQAANRPVREVLGLEEPIGRPLGEVLGQAGLESVAAAAYGLAGEEAASDCELTVSIGGQPHRIRIRVETLEGEEREDLGRVIFVREISHEPLRRRFDDTLLALSQADGDLREPLQAARATLGEIARQAGEAGVRSYGMAQLSERISRTCTAIDHWLEVDEALAREDYPDAQLLQDRLRVATARWPLHDRLPGRVQELTRRVEEYYESGENPKRPVL